MAVAQKAAQQPAGSFPERARRIIPPNLAGDDEWALIWDPYAICERGCIRRTDLRLRVSTIWPAGSERPRDPMPRHRRSGWRSRNLLGPREYVFVARNPFGVIFAVDGQGKNFLSAHRVENGRLGPLIASARIRSRYAAIRPGANPVAWTPITEVAARVGLTPWDAVSRWFPFAGLCRPVLELVFAETWKEWSQSPHRDALITHVVHPERFQTPDEAEKFVLALKPPQALMMRRELGLKIMRMHTLGYDGKG